MQTPYDAFISYSRRADEQIGPAIKRALESLARPLLHRRACDVFLDRTSLAADPSLWGAIVNHLARSRWFVLLASPASAESEWCVKELQWWLERNGTERLLIVVTGGEIAWDAARNDFDWTRTTALSKALGGRFVGEPLYVDLRTVPREPPPMLRDAAFRAAMVDLAAPIRGMRKDELDAEDLRAHRRAKRLAVGVGLVVLCVTGVAAWQTLAKASADRGALAAELAEVSAQEAPWRPDVALRNALAAHTLQPDGKAALAMLGALSRAPHFQRYVVSPGPAPSQATAVSVDSAHGLLVTVSCVDPADACRRSSLAWQHLVDGNTRALPAPRTLEVGRIEEIDFAADGSGTFVYGDGGAHRVDRALPDAPPAVLMRGRPVVALALGSEDAPRAVAFQDEAKIFHGGGRGIHGCTAFGLQSIARNGLAMSPRGTHVAAADGRGGIEVVRLQDCRRTRLRIMDSHGAIGFDGSGRWLLAVTLDGARFGWEVDTAQPMRTLGVDTALAVGDRGRARSPHAMASTASALAMAEGNQVRLYQFAAPGEPTAGLPIGERWAALPQRRTLFGHGAPVTRTRFSADSSWMLSTDSDGVTVLWRLDLDQPLLKGLRDEWSAGDARIAGLPSAWESRAAQRSDGLRVTVVEGLDAQSEGDTAIGTWRIALTAGTGGTAAEGAQVVLAKGRDIDDRPRRVQFAGDGSLLVERESGAVMVWRLATAELLRRACIAVGRAPSLDEIYKGRGGMLRWGGPNAGAVCDA